MYSAAVLDHVVNSRNCAPLMGATHRGVAGSPGDGPHMVLEFIVRDGMVERAAYGTYGCPAAVACGSLTAEIAQGKRVEQLLKLTPADVTILLGGLPESKTYCPELVVEALQKALGPGAGSETERLT